MSKPVLSRMIALILAVGVLPAAHAGATSAHGKKAGHKATARKRPPSVSSGAALLGWKPDAKLLSQLQPETQFGAFSMRLPAGYTVEKHDMGDPTTQVSGWLAQGPQRADGLFPALAEAAALTLHRTP